MCNFECIIYILFLDSSMVEHTAVNRGVVGSSPTRGAGYAGIHGLPNERHYGSMVKRLRHRPFTAVTGVQIPLGSLMPTWLNWQSS